MDKIKLEEIEKAALAKKEAQDKKNKENEDYNIKLKSEVEAFNSSFNSLITKVKSDAKQTVEAAKTAGSVTVDTNENATDLKDKIRKYVNVYFKPKGFPSAVPMQLTFEGLPSKGTVSIKQKTGFGGNTKSEDFGEFKIENLTPEKIGEYVGNFVIKAIN